MKNQKLRIIGGSLRSRLIQFPSGNDTLRPTADRIRETLFNWLSDHIIGSNCLDAFAGSGALGIEALSRGAKHVTFIEKSKAHHQALKNNLSQLELKNQNCLYGDTTKVLTQLNQAYDIIFLDPPFSLNILPKLIDLIVQGSLLTKNALVYFEQDKNAELSFLDEYSNLEMIKHKTTSNVQYGLLQKI
ncbi:16S rRNA (guanine(966)-N(2))-methyltransferase RsmD [Thiotrichales bacterium 19S9-12]|nr:16S rRNA (guanine(966)-N(2))-methyltransferase RsmD [Thiotrichales bacterium 19S9-11]MCF6812570.1 16S rRNA (guanine(966)-N(2))-methyltransferase RsmD [Thiotrichales bacterium 19S9-12]